MSDWIARHPRLARALRVVWQPARDCRLERVQAAVAEAVGEISDLRARLHIAFPVVADDPGILELVNKLDDVA